MTTYEEALIVLRQLFAKDCQFALATSEENIPSVRFTDTFYDDGAFYIVTYAKSRKVKEIEGNPRVELCDKLHRFGGKAYNIGHPLSEYNLQIREKLIKAFEPWYFAHNNENDPNMCYVKIELSYGFFHKDGIGYRVDFINEKANKFPFTSDIITVV